MATDAPTGPVVPTKRVVSKAHLEAWLTSGTHDEVVTFVEQLNEAAVSVKLTDEVPTSEIYVDEGDVQRALNAAIRLSVFRRRWYDEQIHPTVVSKALFKLIRTHGLAKVSYTLVSMNVPQAILKQIMQGYFQFAQTFRTEGSDF
ncbi:ChAPs family protein [Rhodotorula toruloides ATCC 204091]|uniref:Chaps family protein n=1 Tax=Rhodotorula toruloides TaxID=5286 RepID=A0A2T0AEL5_RHOTO|nr:ChAPs family protein [Rhodotorula toruloides ATCC 204091]PRQ76456.1 chaps family protein [Rhodotorula toruloides]